MKKFFQIPNKLIISVLIFSLLILLIFSSPSVQAESIQTAVDYLKTQTTNPWITMALVAAGETDLDLNYLKTVGGNLATDYEKTILALTAAGKNPRTFGEVDFIAQLKTFYQSNQIGSDSLLNDDFWGILALLSAGENLSDEIIQGAKNFILINQNSDGGWGYALSEGSDTNDTAIAIMALLEAGVNADEQTIINAVNFLRASQNIDGGFPYVPNSEYSESDAGSDAWVISAIYKLGQNPYDWQKEGQNPVDHLKSLQRADGSFKWIALEDVGYPTLTADAVIALSQKSYPVKRLPLIIWANPADITYGTAINTAQLNAISSVEGTFVYTPGEGTILNVGPDQTLSVEFTPLDTTNYNIATATVNINVLKAAPVVTGENLIIGTFYASSPSNATGPEDDVNGDNKIDKYDFSLMMNNWGKTGSNNCDINGDGKVDKYDFALLMLNWTM